MNMLNGAFMQKQSSSFAEKAMAQGSDLNGWVDAAIETAYSRRSEATERERAVSRVRTLQTKFNLTQQQAFREYCLVLLNSNEFLYLD
jgi:hypothetical protein